VQPSVTGVPCTVTAASRVYSSWMLTFDVLPVVIAGETVMQGPLVYGSVEIILTIVKVHTKTTLRRY
jgi:hypothetical protein